MLASQLLLVELLVDPHLHLVVDLTAEVEAPLVHSVLNLCSYAWWAVRAVRSGPIHDLSVRQALTDGGTQQISQLCGYGMVRDVLLNDLFPDMLSPSGLLVSRGL